MNVQEIIDQHIWNSFITHVEPNTFLHTWQWGELEHAQGRFIIRLGIFQDSTLIAVALFSKITARRGTFLLCPHGPIVDPKFSHALEEIIRALKDTIIHVAKKEQCDFVRISTLIVYSPEHEEMFKKLGFRNSPIHMHSELAWILDVTSPEEILLKNMRKNTRYSIKKAEKDGVIVEMSSSMNDFEKFWNIYIATAERQKFTPYARGFLEKEFRIFMEAGTGVLFTACYNNVPISTAFIVYSNGSGFYHHGASIQQFSGISASELLQWRVIQEAKKRNCKHYNFWGVSPESATKHPWYGLSKFKRGFGGCEEHYVHAKDIVITKKYWLNYIIEHVRRIKRGL